MIFDLFHSISDPVLEGKSLGTHRSVEYFLDQAAFAEQLGVDTVWCAESHFSSETQKKTSEATIPHFQGEVGLNCDSFQLFHLFSQRTKRAHFGTGIHNIVGGSGGPLASAERVNFLHFLNQNFYGGTRKLRWGVASGRFPYQNSPFHIIPRNEIEKDLWPSVKRYVFLEALEIFLRLVSGETLNSSQIKKWQVAAEELKDKSLQDKYTFPVPIEPRWKFESLSLVPRDISKEGLEIVLGSHDPVALDLGLQFWDLSLFNLSFTSPEQIEKLQQDMFKKAEKAKRSWSRSRLPRTVMVFIDQNRKKAYELADSVLTHYIEAMRGTTLVPDKQVLLSRALVGDASEIREQLKPGAQRGFHRDDRIMLWFEFNQQDNQAIKQQMRYFFEEVASKL